MWATRGKRQREWLKQSAIKTCLALLIEDCKTDNGTSIEGEEEWELPDESGTTHNGSDSHPCQARLS